MTTLIRVVGFAALGAGMLHLALAIGSPLAPALVLAAVGAAEFLWGVLAVSRGALPAPRIALAGALVPTVAWILLLLSGAAPGPFSEALRVFPSLVAVSLDLVVAIGVAALLRRPPPVDARPSPLGVAVAAIVIAVITVPALGATEAGDRLGPPGPPSHPIETPH